MNYHTEVVALVPLKHDGRRYEPGEELSLPDARADQLIEQGAVQRKSEVPVVTDAVPEPEHDE